MENSLTSSPPSTDARPTSTSGGVDFPSSQFRHFYGILALASQAARQVSEGSAAAAAQTLSSQLIQLIEIQTLEARRIGGRASGDLEVHARFLKAALADEVLLSADWAGQPHWRHLLLETQLFRSSQAGDKVFDEIDRILSEREPSQRSCALLYLHTLSLGFQGRFRGSKELAKVADYRRELYQFVYQRAPDLQGRERKPSQGAYASTLSHLAAQRLGRASRWSVVGLLVLLALLAVSQLLWLWQSWPVRRALDGVVGAAQATGLLG